jgi:serine O-acetyltransferase
VIFSYAGVKAAVYHRMAHGLHRAGLKLPARLLSQWARRVTGIEIHPGASIGKGLFIDHGMGVVIGETAVIGDNVTLFQGVTLGGTGKEKCKRHPTLGSNVVVGAGAKVLGNIALGDNVAVGANAVVLQSVPANSTVVGVPGRVAKREGRRVAGVNIDYTHLPDPLAQAMDRIQQEIEKIEHELKEFEEHDKK